MTFEETKEQRELRRMLRAFLGANASMEVVRRAAEQDDGFAGKVWGKLVTELELTATAVPVEHDGVGGSFAETAVALEELGRTLLPVPFLSTAVAASVLSGCETGQARDALLGQIVEGAAVALALSGGAITFSERSAGRDGSGMVLDGVLDHVLGIEHAGALLVAVDDRLLAVQLDADGLTVERRPTLDQTRPLAQVRLNGVAVSRLGDGAAVTRGRDLLAAAVALESLGGAEQALDETVEYLKQREQFGRPIGSFQALKHRCAELLVLVERARATAAYAAWAADEAPDELHLVAPMALALSSDAFMQVAAESIQLRGGIGFTWDNDAHLYFKRAKSTQLLHGLPPQLRAQAATRAGVI